MPRLFIVDPALSSHQGHHYSVTNSFSSSAEEAGIDVVWLVNKGYSIDQLDHSSKRKIELTFSKGTYDDYKKSAVNKSATSKGTKLISFIKKQLRRLPNSIQGRIRQVVSVLKTAMESKLSPQSIIQKNTDFKPADNPLRQDQELHLALVKLKCRSTDSVFFHTSDAHTYRDIVSFYTKTVKLPSWNDMPVFHLSTPYDETVMPHNKTAIQACQSIGYLSSLGLLQKRVYLYAENQLLAKNLANSWKAEVNTLYIPQQPFAKNIVRNNPDVFEFCYLGAARTEKGFTFIAQAIENYLARESREDIHFTLQVSPQILGYTADIAIAVKKLKSISDERLCLIEDVQSPEEYQSVLLNADVLLLCYEKERYLVRSSGIVVEALANGKNIISTKGSFPDVFAENASIGVENDHEFVAAINEMANNKQHYAELACQRKKKFVEQVSLNPFLNFISGSDIDTPVSTEIKNTLANRLEIAPKCVFRNLI